MSLQHFKLSRGERILVLSPDGRRVHVTPKNGVACEFVFQVPHGVLVKKLPALAQGLVLERRQGEAVRIEFGEVGDVLFTPITTGRVYVAIDAPHDVPIHRDEIASKKSLAPAAEPPV
jgi:sRNA-binding carbon storage regulator CsrA